MKIGVYVGSFNPVHVGHIKIVNHLLVNYLDKVIIVPTGNYWNKNNLVDINHRISMLKFYENKNIIIDTQNNNIPYTYLLMNKYKKVYKEDDLYLILGADNIVNFDKWKEYKKLLEYGIIIVNRNGIDIKYYLNKLGKKDNYIIPENLFDLNISSTYIRNIIKDKNYNFLTSKLDSNVLEYIQENNLYK